MQKNYFKLLTSIALIALLFLQGLWLYNTYLFFDNKIKNDLDNGFARSIEKEIYIRLNDTSRIPEGSIVEDARPDNDFYLNAIVFHEFLLSNGLTFSLETLDSIWSQTLSDDFEPVGYRLQRIDSTGKILEQINKSVREKSPFAYTIQRPIRNDRSEYLQVIIASPYRIVFGKMLLLLTISVFIAFFIGYCFFIQTKMIIRQERVAESRQDFTLAMVHEMTNPISKILMSTSVLTEGQSDDTIGINKPFFEMIRKGGNQLLSITNKIMTIAQFEDGKIHLSKKDIDVKDLFGNLMAEYLLDPSSAIQFTTDFEDAPVIYADPDYMVDVFRNLIDNAIKYSKAPVAIQIKTTKAGSHTLVKIRDNGMGISRKDQKRIFNKFERVYSRKEGRKSGFGLGLYYVYQVVSAHGGTIKVESVLNSYSEFTMLIPNR